MRYGELGTKNRETKRAKYNSRLRNTRQESHLTFSCTAYHFLSLSLSISFHLSICLFIFIVFIASIPFYDACTCTHTLLIYLHKIKNGGWGGQRGRGGGRFIEMEMRLKTLMLPDSAAWPCHVEMNPSGNCRNCSAF